MCTFHVIQDCYFSLINTISVHIFQAKGLEWGEGIEKKGKERGKTHGHEPRYGNCWVERG